VILPATVKTVEALSHLKWVVFYTTAEIAVPVSGLSPEEGESRWNDALIIGDDRPLQLRRIY
jgi:hypothetical protein